MAKGWLDNYGKQENYNNSKTSVPEGYKGEGYSMKGRNYSPAWGGQFQMGGSVYPVNYVPEAAMGGSIPGAVGFSYARTQSPAPSNGKYAKKTMASAQNGKEMSYYQNGLDFKPKSISKNGAWLDNYEQAQDGVTKFNANKFIQDRKADTPLQRSINKESNSEDYRKWVDTKEYKDKVKANKIAQDKATLADRKSRISKSVDAQKKSFTKDNWRQQLADETQATGDKFRMFPEDPDSFVDEWLNPGVMIGNMASDLGSAPLRAQQEDSYMPYATSIGVPLLTGGLEGIGAKTNKQFISNIVNPLNIVPGYHSAEKAIGKKLGNISTSIAPELRQGLQTAGPSFNNKPLPKELEPYISRIGEPTINREEEVFRNVMGPEYREAKELENTVHLDNNGNIISAPTKAIYNPSKKIGPMHPLKQGGIIKDDRGQWDHPGEITEIGSNDITMEGVPYDVLGVSDEGDTKLMKPGKNYKFKGKKVTEYPMAQNGLRQEQKGLQNLDNLTNFTNYNKPQPGGWLNKYN
jgi:hypothetical protein